MFEAMVHLVIVEGDKKRIAKTLAGQKTHTVGPFSISLCRVVLDMKNCATSLPDTVVR